MSLRDVSASHIRLISFYQTRYTVRGGAGLVFLMITLVFGLTVAHAVLTPIEQIMAQQAKAGQQSDPQKVVAEIVKLGRPVIQWALGIESDENSPASSDAWTTFLLDDRPALLSVIFLILLFGMPLLISFLAFNQIAGDVQNRGLRYLLLRTERANIFIGRFLGTAFFSTLVIAIIIATITFYLGVNIKIYSAGLLVGWALHGFLALSVLMLPYIAICSWISASVDSPFVSLVLAKLIIGGVWLFALLGSLVWKPAIYLNYALPWGLQNHLLHPQLTHSLGTALACLGYMLVFLFLGYYRFETRDL
ncbi:MAG: ABC transporter permease subunit [Phycisphaerae bacterium]|nr:ABC transporter permease subunit [Phycisphaerae bacterium]